MHFIQLDSAGRPVGGDWSFEDAQDARALVWTGGDCHLYADTINAQSSLIEDGLKCVNGSNDANLIGDSPSLR